MSSAPAQANPGTVLDELKKVEDAPEQAANAELAKKSEGLYREFEKKARVEGRKVHSFDSLEASREHIMRLLELVPEPYKRIEMATKAMEQELDLQRSIQIQDFSASEVTWKLRKFLTYCLPIALVLFLGLLFLLPIGKAAWGWNVDSAMYQALADLVKYSVVAAVGSIILYFFKKD